MISIVQLGTLDYATGLRLQDQLVTLRKQGAIGDVLLLLEHKPVITLGRNAKAANVVASPELLAQRGVELFACDRGGDVTFHGPGQIVGYPIFDLRGFRKGAEGRSASEPVARQTPSPTAPSALRRTLGVIEFVRALEDVLMRTCADFAIPTKRIPGLTGVWTDPQVSRGVESSRGHVWTGALARPVEQSSTAAATRQIGGNSSCETTSDRATDIGSAGTDEAVRPFTTESKLAAIGVHISRFVTSHGFALNVNTDLTYFNLIIPCGITSKPVTSMQQQLGRALDLNAVAESLSRNFGLVFHSQVLWIETLDALLGRTLGVPVRPPAELRQLHGEDDSHWA